MSVPPTLLVTGAGGFIGSHTVEAAVRAGHTVRALCRYNSRADRGWIEDLAPEIRNEVEVRFGDVRDAGRTLQALDGCAAVLHLAALIAIPYSYDAPASYVQTNVQGTMNVLDAARRTGARVAVVSTSEVYGTAQTAPITEAHPLSAQSPYAATKIAADQLALSYHRAFGLPVGVVRPFNTFGPRQSARAVIPTILTQLLAGRTRIALGSLSPTRDFTFVSDTARGLLEVGLHEATAGRVVQLGTGREISIGDLFDLCLRVTGVRAETDEEPERKRPADSEVERLLSDPSLARSLCAWRATVPLEEGLRLTADWLARHLDLYRVTEYTR